MRLIRLTQGQFAKVDDADFEWLSKMRWNAQWNPHTHSFYAARTRRDMIPFYHLQMGRLILGLTRGDGKVADYKNGDTLDNRRKNLRVTDIAGNNRNAKRHRAGRLLGAGFHRQRNKWRARAVIDGKQKYLGLFPTERLAHQAYMDAVGINERLGLRYEANFANTKSMHQS